MQVFGPSGKKGNSLSGGIWESEFTARQPVSLLNPSFVSLQCTIPGLADIQARETYYAVVRVMATIDDGVKVGMKIWEGEVYMYGGTSTGIGNIVGGALAVKVAVGNNVSDLPLDASHVIAFDGRSFQIRFQVNEALEANWVAQVSGIRNTGTQIGT